MTIRTTEAPRYYVIHPLDDLPEEKRSPENLGPMPMSPSARFSLVALRGYLITMGILIAYRVMEMAGVIRHIH
jgi:hypothetical protein